MTTPTEREAPGPDLAVSANGAVSADEIEADIERTREQLGSTIDALSEKLDVKAQARRTMQNLSKPGTAALVEAGLAAGLIIAGAVLVWRRRP